MCSKLRDYQLILHTYTHRDTHTHTHMAIDEPHSNCKPRIYHTHTNTHTRHPKITEKLSKSVHIAEKMSKWRRNKQTNKKPITANQESLSHTHTHTHTHKASKNNSKKKKLISPHHRENEQMKKK